MQLQTNVMNYAGSTVIMSLPQKPGPSPRMAVRGTAAVTAANGVPDFSKMSAADKVAYHRARWKRILG